MARMNCFEEFRRQAVDLYESTPGATVRGIADDLAIVRGTLRHWLEAYGTGKTAADGTLTSSPLQSRTKTTSSAPGDETSEEELHRLRTRVAELEVETTKLTTEREMLSAGCPTASTEGRACRHARDASAASSSADPFVQMPFVLAGVLDKTHRPNAKGTCTSRHADHYSRIRV